MWLVFIYRLFTLLCYKHVCATEQLTETENNKKSWKFSENPVTFDRKTSYTNAAKTRSIWDTTDVTVQRANKSWTSTDRKLIKKTNCSFSGTASLCWLEDVLSTSSEYSERDESKAGNSVPGAFGIGGTEGSTPVGLHRLLTQDHTHMPRRNTAQYPALT